MSGLSQEEVISNTKLLMQGLESLKTDTCQLITASSPGDVPKEKTANNENDPSNASLSDDERIGQLKQSLEMIEWGISEAQVSHFRFKCT